jgi:hypothetical protein
MVKEAADKNVWYSFLYDVFLNVKMPRWGEVNTILHYLMHPEILRVIVASHHILPLMTCQFVFMLPFWRTSTQQDRLQFLVEEIQTNHFIFPRPNRVLQLLWASRYENIACNVDEVEIVNK